MKTINRILLCALALVASTVSAADIAQRTDADELHAHRER